LRAAMYFRPRRDKVRESRRSAALHAAEDPTWHRPVRRLRTVNLKKKPYFSGNDLCLTGPD
jgi:hypothetical protein